MYPKKHVYFEYYTIIGRIWSNFRSLADGHDVYWSDVIQLVDDMLNKFDDVKEELGHSSDEFVWSCEVWSIFPWLSNPDNREFIFEKGSERKEKEAIFSSSTLPERVCPSVGPAF